MVAMMNNRERREAIRRNIAAMANVKSGETVGARAMFPDSVKVADDGTLMVTANTDDIDLDGEVVVPAGANTDYFQRNGQIFADHRYQVTDVIGSLRRLSPIVVDGVHKAWKASFKLYDHNDIAKTVKALAERGGIGVSIGFSASDFGAPTEEERERYAQKGISPGSVVRQWDWLELSATAFPCNVACQAERASVDDSKRALVDELLTKSVITTRGAAALGLVTVKKKRLVIA